MILLFVTSWQLTLGIFGALVPISCYTGVLGKVMERIQEQMQDSKAKATRHEPGNHCEYPHCEGLLH